MVSARNKRLQAGLAGVALCALLATPPLESKRIYTFRDENGVLHFTDRKPNTDHPVEERIVRVDDQPMLDIREEGPPEARRYYFFNRWRGPVEVRVAFIEAQNVVAEPPLPGSFVIERYGEQHVLTVRQSNLHAAASYRLQFRGVPGDPAAKPDAQVNYQLPFRRSKRYFVGQAFGGEASHSDEQSYHAVDITMPEGSPVLAARDGVVMNVEEDFFGAGLDLDRFGARANNIRILHQDGTMAVYAHLQLESVAVKPGQVVIAGELIGFSGNTGYSSGPHLHFVVQRNAGGKLTSLPFRFDDGTAAGAAPESGQWLEFRR